ncbi:DUF1016 N-terminal domain-containing protein [Chryseobacterium sp. 2R14A]|uniref:DUF1016 N-terminal domain-containing protein n=1 Tax=Chryseobacterium sp. 2R14A TaxID=3380353 RepID=UPI003CF550B2
MSADLTTKQLLDNISALLGNARNKVVVAVNQTIVLTYFEIGRMIVEDEQNGENRAEYGKAVLKDLSLHLTRKFGKGFSVSNLKQIRQFYIVYSKGQTPSVFLQNSDNQIEKRQTLSGELDSKQNPQDSIKFNLSWSHYLILMRINDINERKFYEIESFKNNWSLRELQRQYDSALYTRLSLSKNKEEILQLSEKGQIIEKPKDLIKDPYVQYTLSEDNEQIFASKYFTVLPSKEDFINILNSDNGKAS